MENEELKNQGWTPEEKPKKPRGRPKKADQQKKQQEREQEKKEQKQENIKQATEVLNAGFTAINQIFARTIPDDLKKEGCSELSPAELNTLTGATIPVLDKYGLLDLSDNPELILISVIIGISLPRFQAVKRYRKKQLTKKETFVNPGDENDNTGKN